MSVPKIQKVVILGHTGFIGKNLYQWLEAGNFEVVGASSKVCNLLDYDSVKKFVSIIPDDIHVIFCSVINKHDLDSVNALHNNIAMVDNFIRAISRKTLISFIYLSSVDVYGKAPALPINEKTLLNPSGYYGIGKVCCELLLKKQKKALQCPISVLRLPGVYGYNDNGKSIVSHFFKRICDRKIIKINGNGTILRDYVYVNDICRIVEKLIDKPINVTLNLATGKSLTLKQVIYTIEQLTGISANLSYEYIQKENNSAGDLFFDTQILKDLYPNIRFNSLKQGCSKLCSTGC